MGYLVCDKCSGYYELQEGESPNNFNLECECSGNLISVDVNDGNTQKFNNIKEDYNELLGYLKDNRLNFKYKKGEIPISLDNGEKVLLNFENIKLANSTGSNNESEIDTGYLTLTNKKIVFSGNNTSIFDLGEIKSIKSFYNGFGIVLNNEFELKEYFLGIDQMKIVLPLKAWRNQYSVHFNGEMAKIMIENAIKNHKDALESDSKDKKTSNNETKEQKKNKTPDFDEKEPSKVGKCLLQARGTTGMVELFENGVRICTTSKTDFKSLYHFHLKNTKDYEKFFIYDRFVTFDEIDYVLFEKTGVISAGSIRFILSDDSEEQRVLTDASDEKQIGFRPNQQPLFEKIYNDIESRIKR